MITHYEYGKRIGKSASLRIGCSAIITNNEGHILLIKRTDNAKWSLPSGGIEPGENVEEGCIREIKEETGLDTVIVKLIGIYSSPDIIIAYPDGNRFQVIGLSFLANIIGGEITTSNESSEIMFFAYEDIMKLNMMEAHKERLRDFSNNKSTFYLK